MSNSRKRRPQTEARKRPGAPAHFHQVAGPRARLKDIFKVFDEIVDYSNVASSRLGDPANPLVRFDASIFSRAFNALKVAWLLLDNAHWEFASGPVRQIFELVVNMEHLGKQVDRNAACIRYLMFGMLQEVRLRHRELLYNRRTGRPVDPKVLAELEAVLQNWFTQFHKGNKADGSPKWAQSWCDRNTKELVDLSSSELRKDQYSILYSTWSDEVHGSPRVMVDTFFLESSPGWIENLVASDDAHVGETAAMAISLFFELWILLPYSPELDRLRYAQWMQRVMRYSGQSGATEVAPESGEGSASQV